MDAQQQQLDHLSRVTSAMDDLPTLVVQYISRAYGAGSYSAGRFSVGVRGEDDWMEEPDFVDRSAVDALIYAYSGRVSFMADDDSDGAEAFWAKVAADQSPSALTCKVDDAADFIRTALATGAVDVTIDGVAWRVIS